MSNKLQNDKLKEIVSTLADEAQKISKEQTVYFGRFPKGAGLSLWEDAGDHKKLATAYYKFVADVAESLSRMEDALAQLPAVMTEADRNFCYDTVATCDELLKRYGELKSSVSSFAERNERLIIENRFSPRQASAYLSELGYKLNYFDEYLRGLSLALCQ